MDADIKRSKAQAKLTRIPVVPDQPVLRKPDWIRTRFSSGARFHAMKRLLRERRLHTVCEEASCPNISECFGNGTATFMILGDLCTRRCPFCDVAHGRPAPPDDDEPLRLAEAVTALRLQYVVITSVDRDDLRDGGAGHFACCIKEVQRTSTRVRVEILVPDFRGRLNEALRCLAGALPHVFNHNLETVPRLYRQVRPGADYLHSLNLLRTFKQRHSHVPTKSGLMLGLGETDEEVVQTMEDLRKQDVDMLTLGQYLQPSVHHLPVARYVEPGQFVFFKQTALKMQFRQVASGPMVRSSYHADEQAAFVAGSCVR
jgi:lipoic acid synthetase